jgi:site-specific DNA-methyltransferase (adenine-specific)
LNSVDLIIIDPPYGKIINQKWDNENGLNLVLLNKLYDILKPTGSIYIFCGIGEKSNSLLEDLNIITKSNFIFKDLITWKKQKGYGARKGWLYTREEIIWCVKSKNYIWNEDNQYSDEKRNYKRKIGKSWYKRLTNVWTDIKENLFEDINSDRINGNWKSNLFKKYLTLHKTIKPIKLLKRIILSHTQKNDIVLDCFAGSGSTGIACKELERNYILIEKEKEYFDIFKKELK